MENRKDIRLKISGSKLDDIEQALDIWYYLANPGSAAVTDEYNHGRYDGAISILSVLGLTVRSTVGTNDKSTHIEYHGN